jgi:hypothetical protein
MFYNQIIAQDEIDLQIAELKKQYSIPSLTKEQMYADFDTLIAIMERCNPQYLIRKKVTGYDMITEMKLQRKRIDTIQNMKNYILLLSDILELTQDQHCIMATNLWWYQYDIYKKDIKINAITEKELGINFNYQDIIYNHPDDIQLIRVGNSYFLKYTTILYDGKDSTIIPSGGEVLAFNAPPPLAFPVSRCIRWNFNQKMFYNNVLSLRNGNNNIRIRLDSIVTDYKFTTSSQSKREYFGSKFEQCFLSKDNILYIKVPFMMYHPELMLQIKKDLLLHKTQKIESVLIDVRGNPGGNDRFWIELLGTIIDKSIKFPFRLIACNDKDVFKRIGLKKEKKTLFNCIGSNYDFVIFEEEEFSIKKQKNNLGYSGTIYVLVDQDIASSAKSLASVSFKTEKIKSIGIPTGQLGGQGITAPAFILPHSRFSFFLDVVLDATNIVNAEDFYFDCVNYTITPSLDYYLYWYGLERSYVIDKKAMYEHDEIFLKALEIIKQEKNK